MSFLINNVVSCVRCSLWFSMTLSNWHKLWAMFQFHLSKICIKTSEHHDNDIQQQRKTYVIWIQRRTTVYLGKRVFLRSSRAVLLKAVNDNATNAYCSSRSKPANANASITTILSARYLITNSTQNRGLIISRK